MTREELNSRVYSAMRTAEKKMNEQVAQFLNNRKNLCAECHDYEPSLSDFLAELGEAKKEFADIDFTAYSDRTERLHTDFLCYGGGENNAERKVVRDYFILDESEYNETIFANCDRVEFVGYTLVVVIDEYYIDYNHEETGTPLQCLQKIASSKEGEHWINNRYGKNRSFSVKVEEDELQRGSIPRTATKQQTHRGYENNNSRTW